MAGSTLGYLAKQTRVPGEQMSGWKKEWDKLTEKDKEDMHAWAEQEMALAAAE